MKYKRIMRLSGIFVLLIVLGGCSGDDDDGSKISKKFYKDCLKVLSITQDVITNKDIFTKSERDFVNKFVDRKHNHIEQGYNKRIQEIRLTYFGELNFKDWHDPKNDDLVNKLLKEIAEVKADLTNEYESKK